MTNRTDDFNRADSAVSLGTPSDGGSAWVAYAGTWGINTNRGYLATVTSQSVAALESSVSDIDVQVTAAVNGADYGIVGRLSDNNNYLMGIAGTATNWRLYKRVAGAFTQIGSTGGFSPANGDVLKLTFNGSSLNFLVNGVSQVSTTDSFNLTATKHGIRASSDIVVRFDDFSIVGLGAADDLMGQACM